MLKFSVTYEIVTPESAEHGDAAERGYIAQDIPLREAIDELGYGTQGIESNEYPVTDPRWITAYCTNDGTRRFYEQGETESRSLHFPDSMTAASKLRVCRLLDVYGC